MYKIDGTVTSDFDGIQMDNDKECTSVKPTKY